LLENDAEGDQIKISIGKKKHALIHID